MLIKGNKVKMIKALGDFNKVGDIFEVTNISDEGSITIKAPYGIGIMSYKEFEQNFEIYKEIKWTDWIKIDGKLSCYYKTNNVDTVIVKRLGVVKEARLHPDDVFDLNVGIEIAYLRATIEIHKNRLKRLTI